MKQNELSRVVGSYLFSNGSCYWLPSNVGSKDIKELKFQKPVPAPKDLIKQIDKFYKGTNMKFDTIFEHGTKVKKKFKILFDNSKTINEFVIRQLRYLKEIHNEYKFNETINKYRNIEDLQYSDWYITYKYIDTLWNLKCKKETVSTFLSYNPYREFKAQDLLSNIEFDCTISNDIKDKMELRDHLWFNGSCQNRNNVWWNAQWYHDLYYNWWMCVIKIHLWDAFVWRSLARIMYGSDGIEYLYPDRIYREWIFAHIPDVEQVLTKQLIDLWYNIITHRHPASLEGRDSAKDVFIWHARDINPTSPYTYYNNGKTLWVITWDNKVFDVVNGISWGFSFFKYVHGSDKKA